MTLLRSIGAAVFAATVLPASATQTQSLFERLGGLDAIECVVEESIEIIVADDRINAYFAGDLNEGQPKDLKDSLIDYFCSVTGGGCEYSGRDMACAHAGLGIDNQAHNVFVEDLAEAAVDKCGADPAVYAEVSKFLLSLRPEVVQDDPREAKDASKSCRRGR